MPLTLPYCRERHELPADLPIQHEIENSSEHLTCHRDARFDRVVAVKELFVVKYGIHASENEGYALIFIEDSFAFQHLTCTQRNVRAASYTW
jgi:hypothetical protein